MTAIPVKDDFSPSEVIEKLVARHGLRAVLAAMLASVIRRRKARKLPPAGDLPDHLRRDIGLPPQAHQRQYWELR